MAKKFWCHYCNTFITHDSQNGRKQHNSGNKHQSEVRRYYTNMLKSHTQILGKGRMTFAKKPPEVLKYEENEEKRYLPTSNRPKRKLTGHTQPPGQRYTGGEYVDPISRIPHVHRGEAYEPPLKWGPQDIPSSAILLPTVNGMPVLPANFEHPQMQHGGHPPHPPHHGGLPPPHHQQQRQHPHQQHPPVPPPHLASLGGGKPPGATGGGAFVPPHMLPPHLRAQAVGGGAFQSSGSAQPPHLQHTAAPSMIPRHLLGKLQQQQQQQQPPHIQQQQHQQQHQQHQQQQQDGQASGGMPPPPPPPPPPHLLGSSGDQLPPHLQQQQHQPPSLPPHMAASVPAPPPGGNPNLPNFVHPGRQQPSTMN